MNVINDDNIKITYGSGIFVLMRQKKLQIVDGLLGTVLCKIGD